MTVDRDPNYDFVEPVNRTAAAPAPIIKRGIQCGQCGMKFDYGVNYGYHCHNVNCPTMYSRQGI